MAKKNLKQPNVVRECQNCGLKTMRHPVIQPDCPQCGGWLCEIDEKAEKAAKGLFASAGRRRRIKGLAGQKSLFDKHVDTGD
jgi:ribosomal protein L32